MMPSGSCGENEGVKQNIAVYTDVGSVLEPSRARQVLTAAYPMIWHSKSLGFIPAISKNEMLHCNTFLRVWYSNM